MEIGQALKSIRKNLHLSQTEMAGNVLTKSYYSKIERGIHEINASDLIKILMLHQIDINDFFASLGVKDDKMSKDQWMSAIRQAYYKQDIARIKQLEKEVGNVKADDHTLQVLQAIATIVRLQVDKKKDLTIEQKDDIKALIFETNDWNEDSLELFSMSFSFWKDSEREELIRSILKKYAHIQKFSQRLQNLVSAILVNYLSFSIRNREINKRETIRKIFTMLDSLPQLPDNCFAKIMSSYYQAYFLKDDRKIQDIIDFLRNNKMNEIAEVIKVSI
ncbi:MULTISPECIES: helix-turn-helix domain-containing protein [Lactobacillus]|uniref:Helix-turn-helix domain-containing protein n=1 Tax=Lactobacillus xujianguonis TaxID=2495899 RepID=A0A437SX93_9LACO|nr:MULTISPECIES: Rgg/GadR/MutR family transcriptional regulator [Lactobacillus]RVU71541.1 helix-turn-helix domain-containing protein [Lactobacillus xujianguonis]RVU76728.1 helix-turn-helix domain-containing protein [Lactobacillus xujianguonis]